MFLYRGAATAMTVAGDFNGWQPAAAPARRLGTSDAWVREEVFPRDARLDYKFVLNGANWILDPENPLRQRSGYGDNSELRLPDYEPSPWVVRDPSVPRGALTPASLASARLGYIIDYVVYTPAGYAGLADLPVMYVTDGHEYSDPLMGSMVEVLDNLIAAGRLRPVMAVFIDPRVGGTNLRHEQYILNPDFAWCVAHELVPAVDAAYATDARRAARGILGTSLGGLNAAYFGVRETDTFRLIACQSPAFQAGDGGIGPLYEAAPLLDLDIIMTWGTMHDTADAVAAARVVLDAKGYDYATIVVNEGHSWGNWRALLDDVLLHCWATP
jgi:enterochelin esterase family protein